MTRTASTKHGFEVFDNFLRLFPCQEMASCGKFPFIHDRSESAV